MMKRITFIAMLFFLAALIFFIATLSFDEPLFHKDNNENWIGIGVSVCGFLLTLIIKRYHDAKENLEKNDK